METLKGRIGGGAPPAWLLAQHQQAGRLTEDELALLAALQEDTGVTSSLDRRPLIYRLISALGRNPQLEKDFQEGRVGIGSAGEPNTGALAEILSRY